MHGHFVIFFVIKFWLVAGRAVPSGIWLGGNLVPRVGHTLRVGGWIQKFGHSRAPSKKNFRKANIFPENVGGVDVLFPKTTQTFFQTLVNLHYGGLNLVFNTFFDLNSSIFNTSRNSSIPGPHLGKLGPLIYFSLGCYPPPPTPPPPPPVVPALLAGPIRLAGKNNVEKCCPCKWCNVLFVLQNVYPCKVVKRRTLREK
jgi:hypothetical protein